MLMVSYCDQSLSVCSPSSMHCQLFALNNKNKMATRAKNRKTFKGLLMMNQKMDFEITIQECFLGDPQPKLLKQFHYVEQNGHQGYK